MINYFHRRDNSLSQVRKLFPALHFVAHLFGHLLLTEGGAADSLSLLGGIVVQEPEHLAREEHNGNEVADCHQTHRDIGKAPSKVEAHHSTTHHHSTYEHAVNPQVYRTA